MRKMWIQTLLVEWDGGGDEKGGGCGAGGGETPQILLYMTPLIAPTTHPRSAPYTEGLTDFIGGTPNPPFNIARFHLLETTDLHV